MGKTSFQVPEDDFGGGVDQLDDFLKRPKKRFSRSHGQDERTSSLPGLKFRRSSRLRNPVENVENETESSAVRKKAISHVQTAGDLMMRETCSKIGKPYGLPNIHVRFGTKRYGRSLRPRKEKVSLNLEYEQRRKLPRRHLDTPTIKRRDQRRVFPGLRESFSSSPLSYSQQRKRMVKAARGNVRHSLPSLSELRSDALLDSELGRVTNLFNFAGTNSKKNDSLGGMNQPQQPERSINHKQFGQLPPLIN
mmetsp:Transcript_21554/g.38223  ORF Transcript_21554/g.38223 Transcript_21554/m.38223 type:complete len:250 (-) Transcript_21554:242-991(-)